MIDVIKTINIKGGFRTSSSNSLHSLSPRIALQTYTVVDIVYIYLESPRPTHSLRSYPLVLLTRFARFDVWSWHYIIKMISKMHANINTYI